MTTQHTSMFQAHQECNCVTTLSLSLKVAPPQPYIWEHVLKERHCWILAGLQGQTIVGVRTIQKSYHDVGIGPPVDPWAEERTPEPVLAQLGLHASDRATGVFVSRQRSVSVRDYRRTLCPIIAGLFDFGLCALTLSCFSESWSTLRLKLWTGREESSALWKIKLKTYVHGNKRRITEVLWAMLISLYTLTFKKRFFSFQLFIFMSKCTCEPMRIK